MRLQLPHPGHSGGTAPASHRTSLDHRPFTRASVSGRQGPQLVDWILLLSGNSIFRFSATHARRRDLAWLRASGSRESNPRHDWPRHDRGLCRRDGHALTRSRNGVGSLRRSTREMDRVGNDPRPRHRLPSLCSRAARSAIMQTMKRTSIAGIVLLGCVIGTIAGALTAVPAIGVSGGYMIALLGGFAGFIFIVWPEIRDQFSKPSPPPTQGHVPDPKRTRAS
jgi:hypothetical protein